MKNTSLLSKTFTLRWRGFCVRCQTTPGVGDSSSSIHPQSLRESKPRLPSLTSAPRGSLPRSAGWSRSTGYARRACKQVGACALRTAVSPSPEHPICICLLFTLGPGTAASTRLLPQKSLHKRSVARRNPPPPTIIRFLPSGLGIKRFLSPHLPRDHFTALPREARLPSGGRGGTPGRRGESPTCVGQDSDSEARLPLIAPETETDNVSKRGPKTRSQRGKAGRRRACNRRQRPARRRTAWTGRAREDPAPSKAGRGGGSQPAPGSPSRLPGR